MDSSTPARTDRPSIGVDCLLVAGVSVGIWLFGIDRENRTVNPWGVGLGILGGASVIGPPVLLLERRRRRRRWRPGEILWFSQGMSAWLMWPPVIVARMRPAQQRAMGDGSAGTLCFAYGTPLMAIYVGSALLLGGWVGRRGRRRSLSWRERVGLVLGVVWACTGLYALYVVYTEMK